MSFCKGVDADGAGQAQKPRDFVRRLQLGIDDHRDPELCAQIGELIGVVGGANTCDRCAVSNFFCHRAAEQIELVAGGDRDEQVGMRNACLH